LRLAAASDPGHRLVPKLALATAAMTILAAVLSVYSARSASRPATTLDSIILSGVEDGEGDSLLDALVSTEGNDG
jgi:hypothetical protein